MPTVYITNRSGHDHSAAQSFAGNGEIVYLTEGIIPALKTNKAYRALCEKLRNSTNQDYLLQSGPSILNMLAAAIMARKHGVLNLLIYRHGSNEACGRYVSRRIMIDELIGGTCEP